MKFQCRKCRYVTSKEGVPKRCPYCGEAGTMQKSKDAQDILDEVMHESNDRQDRNF